MTGRAEKEWLELLADLMSSPLTELPIEPLARQLNRTFDGVACAFSTPSSHRHGVETLTVEVVEWISPCDGALSIKRVHPAVHPHPIIRIYLDAGCVGALQPTELLPEGLSDVASWNCRHRLGVPLSAPGHRAFVLGRATEFGGREIDLAKRIQRLIVGLDQQVRTLASVRVMCAAGRSDARITPRELAVLAELARGVTAAVISRRLGISERTVHKHLEHIYGKLEVTDRLSAVLRARDAGLIAAQ
jgi:DNA-binding CsgD family transcriptional regulator